MEYVEFDTRQNHLGHLNLTELPTVDAMLCGQDGGAFAHSIDT